MAKKRLGIGFVPVAPLQFVKQNKLVPAQGGGTSDTILFFGFAYITTILQAYPASFLNAIFPKVF